MEGHVHVIACASTDAVERRHRGRRLVDLRAAATEQQRVGVRSDDRDRVERAVGHRQHPPLVLEQHRALRRRFARERGMLGDRQIADRRRGLEHPQADHRAQDPQDLVVDHGLGHLAGPDGLEQQASPLRAVAGAVAGLAGGNAGLVHVQAAERRLHRAQIGAVIAHDETAVAQIALQDVVLQRVALARAVPVDAREGAHDGRRVRLADHTLPRRRVELAQRALVDRHVDGRAPVLLGVEVVMLDRGTHARNALDARGVRRTELAGQQRILREGLERTRVKRIAQQIDGRREHHVEVRQVRLDAQDPAIGERAVLIERRRQRGHGRQQRRLATAHLGRHPHAHWSVGRLHGWDTEPLVGVVVEAVVRVDLAGHEIDLLLQRHLRQQRPRPLLDRRILIPRRIRLPVRSHRHGQRHSNRQTRSPQRTATTHPHGPSSPRCPSRPRRPPGTAGETNPRPYAQTRGIPHRLTVNFIAPSGPVFRW
jgi:hypothetical protein